jgi:pSer/pThr/pTyr-binding forkhead associated (FHA) protein
MWKLTIEDDEGKQTALPLAHEEYALGRGESNAIRLTDRNISRSHAILKQNGQGWFLKDLQSYNGTYVNGVRVVGEQIIQSGDLVQIGDYRLELLDEASSQPSAANATTTANIPPVHQRPNRLVVVVGPTLGAEFPLDKEHFTIGRSEEATISVNHSSVSRIHAELIALGNGRFEIVDKASANGIRINGVELKRGILEAGDALELGDVRLRFVGAGKIYRAGADQSQQLAAAGAFESVAPSVHRPDPSRSGMGIGKILGLSVLAGVVVIVAVVMLVRPGQSTTTWSAPKDQVEVISDDAAQKKLDEAQEKLGAKDYEGAHRKALEIPESSPARDDPAFKAIEASWADAMFRRVEQATANAQKKTLLKEINATPSVDAERRKKAADMVSDIEAKEPPPPPPPPPPPVQYNPAESHPPAHGGAPSNPASTPSANKVELNAVPGAIPQDLAEEDLQRKLLEPKVWGGRGTLDDIRMLKAICSHLGNKECRDRAAALLKKKLEQAQ